MTSVDVKIVNFESSEYHQMIELRDMVLRKPLGLRFSSQDLAQEANQIHICAFIENRVVGTTLLLKQRNKIKMRQVAVHPEFQKHGIGRAMAIFSEDYAIKNKISCIYCHARKVASGFYLKLGYGMEGAIFEEVGIEHYKMFKMLQF